MHASTKEDALALRSEIVRRDKAFVWHPYTPMDVYEALDPFVIARAEGVYLEDVDGRRYIDANSSWWVANLGHRHPRICAALVQKSESLLHCSLAGTTHEDAAFLAEELLAIAPPGLERVFYSDNGSTAIEVAIKASIQGWAQLGKPQKKRFVALDGAFHGDTLGVTALGGVEFFRRPFADVVMECARVPFPSAEGYEAAFAAISDLVTREHESIAAIVVEAIVQGAAGMRTYPAKYLRELRALCTQFDVFLVVDEVFSGYGRTGPFFACEHAGITPDFLCIGKAFASVLPMAATLCTKRIEQAFRGARDQ
ncbi:MAG: aminotransferase class III-fold pyridoxal phosphate-dependent enzyme, partial [Polyangiaceae bacterium]